MIETRDILPERREVSASRGLAALVVGGSGSARLLDTLIAAGATRAWCAVPNIAEAVAVAGLATPVVLDPWPGSAAAFESLAHSSEADRGDLPVVLLRAGTILRRGTEGRALSARGSTRSLVIPVRRGAIRLRVKVRTFRRATIDPGSGVLASPSVFRWLLRGGWLSGSVPTLRQLRRAGVRVRCTRRGLDKHSVAPIGERPAVTVLIPARDEQAYVGDTLRALARQTFPPDEVIVVDDGSSDTTGTVARALGARVIRPPVGLGGGKAHATNYCLPFVRTEAVMILDADTQLHPEALEHLSNDLRKGYDATSGTCLPLHQSSMWARGRAIEYSLALRVLKPLQRSIGSLMVMSGCISMFRMSSLKAIGGLPTRTVTEDLDASWMHQVSIGGAGFTGKALSFPVEPATWGLYKAQMRRWASGFYQTVWAHKLRLWRRPALFLIVAAALLDAVSLPIMLIFLAVSLARGNDVPATLLIAYGIYLMIPAVSAITVIGLRKTIRNFPAFLLTSWAGGYFYIEALFLEWILLRRRVAWVKGH